MRWRRQAAATVAFTVVVKAASPGAHVTIGRACGIMVSGRTAVGAAPRAAQPRKCSDVIGKGAGMMTHGPPGRDWTLVLRRQPARVVAGRPEGRYTDAYELICCDCGDDPDLDYQQVSPQLQRSAGRTRSRPAWKRMSSTPGGTRPVGRCSSRPAGKRPGGGATAGSPYPARLHARHAREARGTPRNGTSFERVLRLINGS